MASIARILTHESVNFQRVLRRSEDFQGSASGIVNEYVSVHYEYFDEIVDNPGGRLLLIDGRSGKYDGNQPMSDPHKLLPVCASDPDSRQARTRFSTEEGAPDIPRILSANVVDQIGEQLSTTNTCGRNIDV